MLLVTALVLGQCTKDIDCKGDRVCVRGECADAPLALVPSVVAADRIAEVARTRDEIQNARAELREASLLGPFVKMSISAAFTGVGAALLGFSLSGNDGSFAVSIILSAAAFVAGAIFGIAGGVQLGRRVATQVNEPEHIAQLEGRLRELGVEPNAAAAAPVPSSVLSAPPPPPPPPPAP